MLQDTHPHPSQSRSHLAGAPAPFPQAGAEHAVGDVAWVRPTAEPGLQDSDVGTLQRQWVLHCWESRSVEGQQLSPPNSALPLPPLSEDGPTAPQHETLQTLQDRNK